MTEDNMPDCRLCENYYPNRNRGNQCAAWDVCVSGNQFIYEQPIRLYTVEVKDESANS